MADSTITPRSEDYSRWYLDVIREAQLAENSPVRGCMVIRPYGYAIWEAIKDGLDRRFKATGHQNAYFPMFIPYSFIAKEAEHIEGFSPELAMVTVGGGKELEEPLVVRPTSETIIGHTFARWIQSYRDLPLLINQWANVVRWEMRTRPFLRTMEFLWQEGHTAHATAEEAIEETMQMLGVYEEMARDDAAIPVIPGEKSAIERFAGAVSTYTIEAMMGNGWALQSGTSHYLGENFSRAFDIKFLGDNNEQQYAHTTSWGVSTRFVGAVIMAHGDDQGLRLPPKMAPIQVAIVPIWRKAKEEAEVMGLANEVFQTLKQAGIRVKLDDREQLSPGYKFNDWEMRGVPLRIEIGPRDVKQNSVVVARRHLPGKEGKIFGVAVESLGDRIPELLQEVHDGLYEQALNFRNENTHDGIEDFDTFIHTAQDKGGFLKVYWAGNDEDEVKIKEDHKLTVRCYPRDDQGGPKGRCFYTGKETDRIAIFARAY
ncbi:MAG: proline--tRNA ligase [Deltaproteobacteria bacterium]|nr:MAG: proline--tRNA ligase [Deltaproteobacteria bacterium]